MKVVMVDGPRGGEVFDVESPMGEFVRFPIHKPIDWVKQMVDPEPFDPHAPLYYTAEYRRLGRVSGRGQIIDVYTFEGYQHEGFSR